jgi:hypothetical protein
VSDEDTRAGYFLGLLGKEQQQHLVQVRKGLEVPCPQPTKEQIEEARDAERSEGI